MLILYILLAILMFGVLIFIHELGHFVVARLCGVDILEFSIGFGPKLYSHRSKKSGTMYSIRLLPLGGYVSMLGENGMELVQGSAEGDAEEAVNGDSTSTLSEEEEARLRERADHAYCNKNVWQRILISIAGPFMNVVLGFFLMFGLVSMTQNTLGTTQITMFVVEYADEVSQDGFMPGDSIYTVDGKHVSSFARLKEYVAENGGALTTTVEVRRLNEDQTAVTKVTLENVTLTEDFLNDSFRGSISEKNGVDGLKTGDVIKKVNRTPVSTSAELVYEVANQGYRPIDLTVVRNGEKIVVKDVPFPTYVDSGATFASLDFYVLAEENIGFGTIAKHALFRSMSTVKMVYDSIFGIFSGRYGVEAVSGPVGITKTISDLAQTGWLNIFHLFIIISINLGIMNLLPIPGLDGGHILMYLIEVVRRKPIKRELEGIINFIGLALLLALALVITIKDIISL